LGIRGLLFLFNFKQRGGGGRRRWEGEGGGDGGGGEGGEDYTLENPSTLERIPTYTGVPQYIRMDPHVLGYPSIWECIPIYLIPPEPREVFMVYILRNRKSPLGSAYSPMEVPMGEYLSLAISLVLSLCISLYV
jgi:hypothetical protein